MQLITHQHHLNALSESPIKVHITARFDQLSQDTDVAPNIVLVEPNDEITSPDYAFVGNHGLLSDLWDEHAPGHPEFARPYEWVCYLPQLQLYEVLLLVNNEDGYWLIIPEAVVETNSDLKWVLTDESQDGLSQPQPL